MNKYHTYACNKVTNACPASIICFTSNKAHNDDEAMNMKNTVEDNVEGNSRNCNKLSDITAGWTIQHNKKWKANSFGKELNLCSW